MGEDGFEQGQDFDVKFDLWASTKLPFIRRSTTLGHSCDDNYSRYHQHISKNKNEREERKLI